MNTARFVDALDTMSDPFLKDVTRQLLTDEVLHGQFGFTTWRNGGVARGDPEVLASLARYLRHAFVVLEKHSPASGRPQDDDR